MKKIILLSVVVVVIIAVSLVGFMGCQGNTSLTQVFSEYNTWNEVTLPETLTYDMYNGSEKMGTLTTKVETLTKGSTYYLGKTGLVAEANKIFSITTDTVNDTFIATTTLTTNDGSYEKTTFAIFEKNYQLLGSYSSTKKDGNEDIVVAYNVNGKKYHYVKSSNWDEEKTIKNGKYETSPYFDNTMIYFVARSIPQAEYSSLTFNIFDTEKNAKEKVTLTIKSGEEGSNLRIVTMTTSDSLLGTTNNISCYVNNNKRNGYKNVIQKIVEGNYSYILQ